MNPTHGLPAVLIIAALMITLGGTADRQAPLCGSTQPQGLYAEAEKVDGLLRERQAEAGRLKVQTARLKGNLANLEYVIKRMELIVATKQMRLGGLRTGRGL